MSGKDTNISKYDIGEALIESDVISTINANTNQKIKNLIDLEKDLFISNKSLSRDIIDTLVKNSDSSTINKLISSDGLIRKLIESDIKNYKSLVDSIKKESNSRIDETSIL